MKQTAVEWFFSELERMQYFIGNDMLEAYNQAKEMERERIETAYDKGTVHGIDYPDSLLPLSGEQYYKETYGGNK